MNKFAENALWQRQLIHSIHTQSQICPNFFFNSPRSTEERARFIWTVLKAFFRLRVICFTHCSFLTLGKTSCEWKWLKHELKCGVSILLWLTRHFHINGPLPLPLYRTVDSYYYPCPYMNGVALHDCIQKFFCQQIWFTDIQHPRHRSFLESINQLVCHAIFCFKVNIHYCDTQMPVWSPATVHTRLG